MNPKDKLIAEAIKKNTFPTAYNSGKYTNTSTLIKDIADILEEEDKKARIEWRLEIHVNKKKFKPFNKTEWLKTAGAEG